MPINPPSPAKQPVLRQLHGETVIDEYDWMRHGDPEEIESHLSAENLYAESVLAKTQPLQNELLEEMMGRLPASDISAPIRIDNYNYFYRTSREAPYQTFCRTPVGGGAEQTVLDVNQLAEGRAHYRVYRHRPSSDHRLLAFSVDATGHEKYSIHVRDLETGQDLPDRIDQTSGDLEWGTNGDLYYVALNKSLRPSEVRRHVLGSSSVDDAVLFQELDPSFYVSLWKSKNGAYIFIGCESLTTTEVHFIALDSAPSPTQLVRTREDGHEYSVHHQGERFLIVSSEAGERSKLCEASVQHPGVWTEISFPDEFEPDQVEAFEDFMAVIGRRDGLPHLMTGNSEGNWTSVNFPEPSYMVEIMSNPTYSSTSVRILYTSLVTPHTIFDCDLATGELAEVKALDIPGGFNGDEYIAERHMVAVGAVSVPLSVVYKRSLTKRDGSSNVLLAGYGAYGEEHDVEFSLERISLLNRGFVVAIAHVRGGGEFGSPWHEAGRMRHKQNTFDDFIACARYLISEGITCEGRIAITGASAGGTLVAAALNQAPELFGAAIADVPFVDTINTLLDESLPLSVAEFEEFGNPALRDDYRSMRAWCPYENVAELRYPPVLVFASRRDSRVPVWEPVKWVARLRELSTSGNPVLLCVADAGHSGLSGRVAYQRDESLRQAFLLHALSKEGP